MSNDRVAIIRAALEALSPTALEIRDDSHKHAGHAGARDGRGHFTVRVISDRFEGLSLLKRQRLVYDALGPLMRTDIHAMAIQARTPEEDAIQAEKP